MIFNKNIFLGGEKKLKIKTVTIIFMMLILAVIPFMNISKAEELDPITINVAIVSDIGTSNAETPFNVLEGYNWTVNNQIYTFSPRIVVPKEDQDKSYLDHYQTDVLILDGIPPDIIKCAMNSTLKEAYFNYINLGGGFIGRCASSFLPLNLSTKPDTGPEWVIEHSGFLDNMLTTSYIKSGFPIITEHFKIIDLAHLVYLFIFLYGLD
jgi:hypothetical protein